MRLKFDQQLKIGVVPIGEVEIKTKNRHQLAPILIALQYIFTTAELNSQVIDLLEEKIMRGKKRTGRMGMSLWEILVLGVVRLSLDIDYDFLLDLANNHNELRGILGVQKSDYTQGKEYKMQTLKDNVSLLDEELIRQINELVVAAGHKAIKEEEKTQKLGLQVKVDSYVVETTIHFPTDINLLWDCNRKGLDTIEHLLNSGLPLEGWRERKSQYDKLKDIFHKTSEIHRKKGKCFVVRLKESTQKYLNQSEELSQKLHRSVEQSYEGVAQGSLTVAQVLYLVQLEYYLRMLDKHTDLVSRRIIKGETIPHEEKVFSIFEPHTEWLSKGKLHKKVELGHNVSIATDQYQFIVDFEIMFGARDPATGMLQGKRIIQNYNEDNYILKSISFDRGYYSSLVKEALSKNFEKVIMPKRGKKTLGQEIEESEEGYKKLRKAHSAVESNINQLEHNGLNRCPDKGERNFRRYVALGILSYNLHCLGKLLLKKEKAKIGQRKKAA